MQRLTTKLKGKFYRPGSRSRSPSLRDGSSQSCSNDPTSTPAPSAASNLPQNGPTTPVLDVQSHHLLPIPTIIEPVPGQESSVHDPPAEAGVQPAVGPGHDGEEKPPTKTPAEEIWDCAYDELKAEEPALVQAYERILTTQLLSKSDATTEAIAEVNGIDQHDKENRRSQMQQLVNNGLDKTSRESRGKSRIDNALPIVNVSKNTVTEAVKGVPQAALPWAAVSLALELLSNPISETKANRTGITHVKKQMDWYCELAMFLFGNQDGSTGEFRRELRTKLIDLYKKLLSYTIKSICSYYCHRGITFLGDLIKFSDWQGALKEIQDAEKFFNKQFQAFQMIDLGQDVKQLVVHAKSEQEYRKTEEDKKCLRDLYITDPRMDKHRIETTKGGLVQDSWRWVLDHSDFNTWLRDDNKRLLWLKGDPGKGKTMLLCGLVDTIPQVIAQSNNAISFFFCQATMPTLNNHLAVLRGLIWLLAEQQPSLISHIREKYDSIGKDVFEGANAWYSLSTIFCNMVHDKKLTRIYIIIDALDECVTGLPELLRLLQEVLSLQKVKWILSSRNWPEIQTILEDVPDAEGVNLSLEVNADLVANAVDAYISEKASKVRFLQRNAQWREEVCSVVRERANGTFLWVAIVFQQLQRMKIPHDSLSSLMERLEGLPKGLTELYDRMLQQIQDLDSTEDSKSCWTVLGICVLAYQPLHLQELATLAGFSCGLMEPSELRTLIGTCGSFLTVKDEIVYFVHQSSKDYLTTNERAQSTLFPNGEDPVHYRMVMRSLETMELQLCQNVYKLKSHAILIDDIAKQEPDPLLALRYPCFHWLHHLCDSMVSFDLCDSKVLEFLRKHILHWLEAMSLMRNASQAMSDVIQLEGLLEHGPNSELFRLVHDIRQLTQHNSWIIYNAPLQIYLSAILFSPKRSIVRSLFENELLSWIAVKLPVDNHWSPCLRTIHAWAYSIALSKDKILAIASSKSLKLWDVKSGKQIRELETKGHVEHVTFSSDSKRVLAAYDGGVCSWDVDSGVAHLPTWSVGDWPSMSHDGRFIASRTSGGAIQIQDMDTGEKLPLVEDHNEYDPDDPDRSVILSNDAKFLAFGQEEVTIWDVAARAQSAVIEAWSLCFSSDSRLVAYERGLCEITILDLSKGCEVMVLVGDDEDDSAATERGISIWDVATGDLIRRFKIEDNYMGCLIWSQDCDILVSAGSSIQVWDMTTIWMTPEPVPGPSPIPTFPEPITFTNDYKLAAMATDDFDIVWDTTTGSELARLQRSDSSPTRFRISPTSELIIMPTEVNDEWTISLTVRDIASELPISPDSLSGLQRAHKYMISQDGMHCVGVDEEVTIWDMSTGKPTLNFTVDYEVETMAFSNNGQYLCLLSSRGTVDVRDVTTGARLKHFKGHICRIDRRESSICGCPYFARLAVSNDSRRVLVGNSVGRDYWIHNEGQTIIRLRLGRVLFLGFFGARESYIATSRGYVNLDGLPTGSGALDLHETITSECLKFEGYGFSSDRQWITWNGSNILWLPLTYRRIVVGGERVAIYPLGLFMVLRTDNVHIIRFAGPPPDEIPCSMQSTSYQGLLHPPRIRKAG
ncbi:WD40 repeat-like protein [Trichoderma longibrachiatum]